MSEHWKARTSPCSYLLPVIHKQEIAYVLVSSCSCKILLALLFLIKTATTTPAISSREMAAIIGTRMATNGTSDSDDDTVTPGSEGDTVTSGSEGGTVTSGSEVPGVLQFACSWGGH